MLNTNLRPILHRFRDIAVDKSEREKQLIALQLCRWQFLYNETLNKVRPRQGSIFDKRQAARLQYRKRLRDSQRQSDEIYTNELHEALLKKKRDVKLQLTN